MARRLVKTTNNPQPNKKKKMKENTQAMKLEWVKASEQLPGLDITLCLKIEGVIKTGKFTQKGHADTVCIDNDGKRCSENAFSYIEWLSESPASPESGDEVINKNHFEYKDRMEILRKHLGDKAFYSTGELHLAIDAAMLELYQSKPMEVEGEVEEELINYFGGHSPDADETVKNILNIISKHRR